MRTLLSSDGPLARVLPGYCEREAQLRMAEAVEEVLRDGGHLVCEAGTGEVIREGRATHPGGTEIDPAAWEAAVQAAIWFFSDRYVLNTSDDIRIFLSLFLSGILSTVLKPYLDFLVTK